MAPVNTQDDKARSKRIHGGRDWNERHVDPTDRGPVGQAGFRDVAWPTLICQARDGCDDSLAEIIRRVRGYLTLVASQSMGDAVQPKFGASDIIQISFLEAHQSIGGFTGSTESEVRAWLKRIVLNNLTDQTRRFRETQSRSVSREVPLDSKPSLAAVGQRPSEMLHRREQDEQLRQLLGRLSPGHQRVVEGRHRFGYTYQQIADQMGVEEYKVRRMWLAATEQLKAWLRNEDGSA